MSFSQTHFLFCLYNNFGISNFVEVYTIYRNPVYSIYLNIIVNFSEALGTSRAQYFGTI